MSAETFEAHGLQTQGLQRASLRERLLNPWPRIDWRTIVLVVAAIFAYRWGLEGAQVDPVEFVQGVPGIWNFLVRLMPPTLEMSTWTIPLIGVAVPAPAVMFSIIETLQMAVIGTSLAIVLAIPFALLAARNTSPHPWVYQGTRLVLNANRAVPEIIFALIFVAAVGLGPFGGVLALAVGSIGSLSKVYAESIEAIDPQQVLAVRATGASQLQIFLYSVIPQSLPLMASYSLLYFEHNVRSATILGLVGAGGVGFIISKYISLFQYHHLMGALALIVLMVTLVDRLSAMLRQRLT